MRMYDLIMKKRNGHELSEKEIRYMITEYTADRIPDYQMSAMLMAIYFRGMDRRETLDLTMAMVHSGETLDLSGVTFMDSAGLGVILGRYRILSLRGGKLTVCGMSSAIDRIFRMSGLYAIVDRQ